jgi:hypothetical protein
LMTQVPRRGRRRTVAHAVSFDESRADAKFDATADACYAPADVRPRLLSRRSLLLRILRRLSVATG